MDLEADSLNVITKETFDHKQSFITLFNTRDDINKRDEKGMTSLHYCCIYNLFKFAKELIKKGAIVDIRNNEGHTPLFYLVNLRHIKLIDLFIPYLDKESKREFFYKVQISACHLGKLKTALFSIYRGAKINKKNNGGWTPLLVTTNYNQLKLAKYQLKLGANIEAKTKGSSTPLHYVCYSNSIEIFKLFIKKGANINSETNSHSSCLTIANEYNYKELYNLLLINGAKVK